VAGGDLGGGGGPRDRSLKRIWKQLKEDSGSSSSPKQRRLESVSGVEAAALAHPINFK
jgi:hypothetical protein